MKHRQISRFQIGDLVQIFIVSNRSIHIRQYIDKYVETKGIVTDFIQYPGGRRRKLLGIGMDVGFIKLFVLEDNYREKHSLVEISFRSIVNAYLIAAASECK